MHEVRTKATVDIVHITFLSAISVSLSYLPLLAHCLRFGCRVTRVPVSSRPLDTVRMKENGVTLS